MRLSQSGSVSSSKRGDGNRLGTRIRKKRKRLDAICEDVFNRSRGIKMESKGNGQANSMGDDFELRRSSRVRRAPEILDASPPPPRKRQKNGEFGKEISRGVVEKVKRKGGLKKGVSDSSDSVGSEEDLGGWKSRLRSRDKGVSLRVEGNGHSLRRKRKLFTDLDEAVVVPKEEAEEEEEEEEDEEVKGDEREGMDGEKSLVVDLTMAAGISDSSDNEVQLHSDGENSSENNGVNSLESEDSEDDSRSMNRSGEKDEEGMAGDGAEQLTMKEDEVLTSTHEETKKIGDECVELINQNNDSRDPSKILEEEGNRIDGVQVGTRSSSLMEDGEHHDGNGSAPANSLEKQVECENAPKPDNQHVSFTDGHPIPRIKEGRRCRLCGGRNDGKPPKRLATDATGSDHETYSCSSASEEPNYDAWDGFGDESGWLGRLLGPINDRYGIAGIWVHQHCAVWSPEVYFAGLGCLKNVRAALCRGRALKCTRCGRPGATLGCRVDRCPKTYHLPCARASGCIFDHRKFLIACGDHRYLFQPQGQQYVQRIKKLKAKKLKLEVKKQSNDASRKDLEAEEKWMEKCGEDEEFLRRENKRLQRDLSRIAPVYIGGAQSEGDEFFEGWESVAGLQDVIQCMKEVVILPLLYPDFFENMGITPPRGVLLHGYPGTGKTLVVRALIGSCARGDKKIAYFARKGADCLGKYVGDAERQLRLLFQVAEKSQPSIIFFDEIDGLAPVRSRQQDQTHSSVVSTLLALMDGLKSRGSVIVIGATNRPDAVDPALRRPGRFDREIYFPLPSVEDRAAILALHTKKWPKPVTGSLLQWIARRTVGFAGADLQALCAHAAIIALKRHCPLQQILSVTQENSVKFKLPQLPNFTVEERDWLEALSSAPPPCSRREAGMAANEVIGSPLQVHFLPSLMQPLTILIISLNLDDRIWLPAPLFKAAASIKRAIISAMEKRNVRSDQWWCHARNLVEESNTANEIKESLSSVGILFGDASCSGANLSNDVSVEDNARLDPGGSHVTRSRLVRNLCFVPKKAGYRILIAGDARSGQKHLVSCLLWCFVGNVEIQKIDLATISQEGHGVMEQGISQILMKCSSMKSCVLFMPRIDLWAIELENRISQKEIESSTDNPSSDDDESSLRRQCGEGMNASQAWRSFVEQMESICMAASLIIVATSEVSSSALPHEVRQFFGDEPLSSKTLGPPEHGLPRFILNLDGSFDRDILFRSSVSELSRDLTQLFIQLIHYKNHSHLKPGLTLKGSSDEETDMETHNCDPQTVEEPERPIKTPVTSDRRNAKSKLSLLLAITTFGYQLLRYPHFAELCWVTSKLKDGPTADIRGPWKGWPFNSCIVRPGNTLEKEAVTCSLSSVKGKDKFNLVRGLVAVGLSAYRGVYISATEVSLEVRKVLELLVEQITAKIQAGKDRYQFIRLLSQVAYIDDMVNSWAYSLRSLERDAQVTPRLTGSGSPDKYMANVQLQAEGDPKIPSIDLDPDNDKGILPGSTLEKPQATDLNKEVSEISVEVSRELVDSRKVPLEVSAEDTQGNGISNENEKGCETFESEHLEEASRSKHLGDVNELNPFANSKDTSMVGGDSQFLEQSNESSCRESLKLETTCFYKCCDQCLPALHQLLQKIITTSSERSSSFSTLEDFHDLISSLSANLCSAVSKSYVTNKNSHSLDEKLSESHEKQSENELVLPRECICHHPEESSSFSQIGFDLKFTYKDGVLVQTDAAKDVDFHCKYEAVCLCSLIESIQNAAASVLTCH